MLDYLDYSIRYVIFWLVFYPGARFCVFLNSQAPHPDSKIVAIVDLLDRASKDATVVGFEMALDLHKAEAEHLRESVREYL